VAVPEAGGARAGSGDVNRVIADGVAGLNYELVDIERAARGLLRVTIDRRPGHAYVGLADERGEFITVEDCERVTRQLQYALEVEAADYARLEVSSPGLDRPLKSEADYRRFAGQEVALTLKLPFEGRKHWRGVLQLDGAAFSLHLSDAPATKPGAKPVKGGAKGRAAVTKPAPAGAGQALGFTFDEVREARLVPVLSFKGRTQPAALAEPAAAVDDKDNGGTAE
jgi:ribosome maturation factor RimP